MDSTAQLPENAFAALKKHWGYTSLRPLQAEAVQAGLSGRDSLVVLPTGAAVSNTSFSALFLGSFIDQGPLARPLTYDLGSGSSSFFRGEAINFLSRPQGHTPEAAQEDPSTHTSPQDTCA